MKKIIVGCALLAVVAFTGCDTLQPSNADQNITQNATERLYRDNLVGRQVLSVTVVDGVATLRGVIADDVLRARAKSIVQSTPGVTKVVDQTVRR